MTPLDVTAFVAGSIVDNAGNALDNSMPAGQNITDNQGNIYIDTTEPTISGVDNDQAGDTINGTYGDGEVIQLTIDYSEPVTVSDASSTITFETGTNDVVAACSQELTAQNYNTCSFTVDEVPITHKC